MAKPRKQPVKDSASGSANRPTLRSKWREVGWPALASSLLMWAAHPPLGWALLAWIAPMGLLWVVDRAPAPGRKGYFCLWLAGCVFWLAILQGIRLAYPPLIAGWLALSLYLAIYVPLFVGISRHLVHTCRWPLVLAAPVVWTGLELWRSYLLTGYAASTLAHTQYEHPLVLQLADQLGGYGVSYVMMSVSVGCYRLLEWGLSRRSSSAATANTNATGVPSVAATRSGFFSPPVELAWAAVLLSILIGYGMWRLREGDQLAARGQPLLRVALIQENTPSMFDADPDRLMSAWNRYMDLTTKAWKEAGPVDVVAWPESTFTAMLPWMENHLESKVPEQMAALKYDLPSLKEFIAERRHYFDNKVNTLLGAIDGIPPVLPAAVGDNAMLNSAAAASDPANVTAAPVDIALPQLPHLLVGNDVVDFHDDRVGMYNAALLISPDGKITNRYEKIHLVMFGEYIPLGWVLKFLSDAFGLMPCTPGEMAMAFEVNGVLLAPSICFESMLPQVISWQMRSLRAQGKNPDVLINITNDSWFRGSSILDHHLACEVLAAVEMRRPFLVAANTGLSAWIAGSGRIIERTERLKPAYIIAQPHADGRAGLTQIWGDLPAWCLAIVVAGALIHSKFTRPRVAMAA